MHEIFRSILPNDLVIDIGANQGDLTAFFVERRARVITVEPQPAMVSILRERFDTNPDVTIIAKGVGKSPGTLMMNIDHHNPVLSSFKKNWKDFRFPSDKEWDSQIEVEVTTLDAIVATYGVPRFTKIDVEGFEANVIAGLSRCIGPLSFEFTGENISDTLLCGRRLLEIGYSKFNVTFGNAESFIFDNWLSQDDLFQMVANHAQKIDELVWGDIYAV